MIDGRSSMSATAWRVRLSLNGSWSHRICTWRCCDARTEMTLMFGSFSNPCPDTAENWLRMFTSPPWMPRTFAWSSL